MENDGEVRKKNVSFKQEGCINESLHSDPEKDTKSIDLTQSQENGHCEENKDKEKEGEGDEDSQHLPIGILRGKAKSQLERKDRLGTLIEHHEGEFESEFKGTPPQSRKLNPFHVTFKDTQLKSSLVNVVEVESYKKYNRLDVENKT